MKKKTNKLGKSCTRTHSQTIQQTGLRMRLSFAFWKRCACAVCVERFFAFKPKIPKLPCVKAILKSLYNFESGGSFRTILEWFAIYRNSKMWKIIVCKCWFLIFLSYWNSHVCFFAHFGCVMKFITLLLSLHLNFCVHMCVRDKLDIMLNMN